MPDMLTRTYLKPKKIFKYLSVICFNTHMDLQYIIKYYINNYNNTRFWLINSIVSSKVKTKRKLNKNKLKKNIYLAFYFYI